MKIEAQRLASPDGRATKPLNHKHVPLLFYNSNLDWGVTKIYASLKLVPLNILIYVAYYLLVKFVSFSSSLHSSEAPSHVCQGLTKWRNVALYSVAAAFFSMSVKSLVSQDSHYIAQIILEKASFRRQNLTLPKPIKVIKFLYCDRF